jgi:hypothetical protein
VYPLFIGESKPPPLQLLLEHTVLFYKIVHDRLLAPTEPPGQGDYKGVEKVAGRWPLHEQINRNIV